MKINNKGKAFATILLASLVAASLLINLSIPVSAVEEPPTTIEWYQKGEERDVPDYAPSGVPDFDQKQDNWNCTGTVRYSLWAHAGKGWGTSPSWQISPGPTLFAAQGETVILTLTAADLNAHNFWIDLNGNGVVDAGEQSPDFGGPSPPTIVWPFTVNTPGPGPWPYSCGYHPMNNGMLQVSSQRWSWCGPTAVADSLWWWDSWIDGGLNPPPAIEDHFPLVQNYGPWDDHDPKNVMPFVDDLAHLMNTDVGQCGTNVFDMQEGVRLYLEEKGLNNSFYERTWWDCNLTFENLYDELYKCEDVILLLGFYQEMDPYEGYYARVGGHYVTVAGMGINQTGPDPPEEWIKISDPFIDYAELMGWNYWPYVPITHPAHSGDSSVHNNASLVSHDPYLTYPTPPFLYDFNPDIGHFCIEGYPWDILVFEGGLAPQGEVDSGPIAEMPMYTVVEYAVIFSPIQYDKPAYPDYAPSKMPDFDQRQDAWVDSLGRWSYCGPVAMANSLWWLDSKYENNTIPPPTIIDNFPLVENYTPGIDDHDPLNVQPFVNELAWLADTDGQRTGTVHSGTYVQDLYNATRWYLERKGLDDAFYSRLWHCNFTFADVEYEVEQCQDVVLLLGFYEFRDPPGEWVRVGGHYVTVSGVKANGTIKFSDPCTDWAEAGGRGEVLPPPPHPHTGPPETLHNNATYVSHDYYNVMYGPTPILNVHWGIWDYPFYEYIYESDNGEAEEYLGGNVFVGVEYAVVTCPRPEEVHDVAVVSVAPIGIAGFNASIPGCDAAYAKWNPGWPYGFYIEVFVENKGDFQETVVVSLYNDSDLIGAHAITLAAHANSTEQFPWTPFQNLTYPTTMYGFPWPYPTRDIKANVTLVAGDVNATNNELVFGTLTIRYPGDAGKVVKVSGQWTYTPADGKVGSPDLFLFGKWGWGSDRAGSPSARAKYEALGFWCDFDHDGKVLTKDLQILGKTWGDSPKDGTY